MLLIFSSEGVSLQAGLGTKNLSDMDTSRLQLWVVLSSILSLAHSFTNCHVIRKRGALDFDSNFIGRIILLVSIIIQV